MNITYQIPMFNEKYIIVQLYTNERKQTGSLLRWLHHFLGMWQYPWWRFVCQHITIPSS